MSLRKYIISWIVELLEVLDGNAKESRISKPFFVEEYAVTDCDRWYHRVYTQNYQDVWSYKNYSGQKDEKANEMYL